MDRGRSCEPAPDQEPGEDASSDGGEPDPEGEEATPVETCEQVTGVVCLLVPLVEGVRLDHVDPLHSRQKRQPLYR